MGFLRKNLGLKIFCLVLSIFLWAWVRYTQAPLLGKNESQTSIYVPIVFINERKDLIMTKSPDKVILTVKGSPKVIDTIRPEHFKATVDLQDKEEGQSWGDVNVKNPPGLTIIEIQPSKANIVLEKLERKSLPVQISMVGMPREGYSIGKPVFEPAEVRIHGAQSTLKRIKEVRILLNVTGVDMDLKQRIQPEPVDKDGNFLPIKVSPEYIKVDLPVRANIRTATLPVNPNIWGAPLQGYKVTKVEVEPPVVTVILSGVETTPTEALKTESIQIRNEKDTVVREVNIIQPPGGSLVDRKTVTVRIHIKKEGT